ncbi:MAG: competence/damage-inducible protein A [Sphingobacteriia bacterium]|nr:competence/damage-inducible protein A [Sphingobacteriia bacterium]
MQKQFKAAVIIIGNEILSGKIADKNVQFLASELNNKGIRLAEVRMIMDIEEDIVNTVNELRKKYDYVFTTGGIGPTHDDITAASMAKAFGRKLILDPRAYECLKRQYAEDQINEARIRMAYLPENSELIANPITHAPGFQVENVYVMAGVPRIAHAMFDSLKENLEGGEIIEATNVSTYLTEGIFAIELAKIQSKYSDVEIGSYPFVAEGKYGTSLVSRSANKDNLEAATNDIVNMIKHFGGELIEIDEEEKQ